MATIMTRVSGDRIRIDVRGHELVVDQGHAGDTGAGPSATELFVASLAACVAYVGGHFLRRHGLADEGLRVDCDWAVRAGRSLRVARIDVRVFPPAPVPPELAGPLQEELEHCTVHEALHDPPRVAITQMSAPAAGEREMVR